nr:unnamed protein product [Callosobruchus analis]
MDQDCVPPFQKRSDGHIVDSKGTELKYYDQVPSILKDLEEKGYVLAVVSKIPKAKAARQLIHLFGWDQFFSFKEIYPGQKTTHFQRIKDQSKIDYAEMLFFDDDERNVRKVGGLGVTSFLVENGVTSKLVEDCIKQHKGLS